MKSKSNLSAVEDAAERKLEQERNTIEIERNKISAELELARNKIEVDRNLLAGELEQERNQIADKLNKVATELEVERNKIEMERNTLATMLEMERSLVEVDRNKIEDERKKVEIERNKVATELEVERNNVEVKRNRVAAELEQERKKVEAERNKVATELELERNKVEIERSRVAAELGLERKKVETERNKVATELELERNKIELERNKIEDERKKVEVERNKVAVEHNKIAAELEVERNKVAVERNKIATELEIERNTMAVERNKIATELEAERNKAATEREQEYNKVELERNKIAAELELEREQNRNYLENMITELSIAKTAAEAANLAKSTFIAAMSHELRTPLSAILGFSELMSQDEAATPKQKETLSIINRSGTHLLNMINDVLDISKIEAGHLELDIQIFDLITLLQDIGGMLGVRAENNKLSFRLEIAPDVPRFINSDSGKLRQILINLLGNAIKFTRQGGVILRANIEPLPVASMIILKLEVADSGAGIPLDQQQKLFTPFVQLAQNHSHVKGTGLGLAISKSLVELMDGHISINSILGVGSTFKIELPVLIADIDKIVNEETWCPVKSIAPDQQAWRLLIVDDNQDNRLLLVTLLTSVGFQTREAENGKEALKVFEEWQPDLIWMDMRMPVMDGYLATTKIRQLAGTDKVKIIALTASVFKEQHQSIINAGCDAVIHKPFQAAEIFAILTASLGVKFIYREKPVIALSSPPLETTVEMLNLLPLELRQQLHEAALNLDTEVTDSVIAQIRKIVPSVADGLEDLLHRYQFDVIINLTNTVEDG